MKNHTTGCQRHRLSNVDLLSRTCFCSVCGETTIYIKSGRPRCATKGMFEQMKLDYYLGMKQIEQIIGEKPEKCPVCKRKGDRRISVDHDHKTGRIRGWLCDKCNIALGYLQEDPEAILALRDYIIKRKGK